MSSIIWYLLPVAPFLTRFILFIHFRPQMMDILKEDELDRKSHRSFILAFVGLSFSGLLALAILDATLRQDFRLSIYYLFLSFLFYISSLNLQSYKAKRWQDQFATTLMESASLCLILSILNILYIQYFEPHFAFILLISTTSIWLIDHSLRLFFQLQHLNNLKKKEDQK